MTQKTTTDPRRIPHGFGSIQMRGNVYWALYKDAAGRKIQENTHTDDPDKATAFCAAKSVEWAKAIVSELFRIAGAKTKTTRTPEGPREGTSAGDRHRPSIREGLRNSSGGRGNKGAAKPAPKGKRK